LKDGQLLPIEDRISKIFNIDFLRHPNIREFISLKRLIPHRIKFCSRILGYLLKNNPDLLVTPGLPHIEGVLACLLSKLQRRPFILKETHWYWPNTLIAKVAWPVNLWMVRRATLLIVPGKRVKKYWEQFVVSDKIKVVPFYTSILKVNRHTYTLAKALKRKFENRIVIFYLGRLLKRKGIDYLIEAFAKLKRDLPYTLLMIAGDGPEKRNLEDLCKSRKLNDVVFIGTIGREEQRDKPSYFQMADVYVNPSITLGSPEEWGLAVIEAMSVGTPVVVTLSTGCALDTVKNGINGYIVPEQDSEALYNAIKTVVIDSDLRRFMAIASKRIVEENFTYDHAVKAMAEAISSVLHNGPMRNSVMLAPK
jgi:glycosyltransferase involved in cell wall biosynthesis